jgi:hypothetical protein
MSTDTSFQPRTCDCSFAPYRHVVKIKAEWNRQLAKQHQDAAEEIPADLVLPPPQPQCLKFKAVEEPREYLVATEPEFREMQLPDKRGSEDVMDEDMEVLWLPKRRHTEPSVEASRWLEQPFLEPGEDEYDAVIRELHNQYDAYLPEPPPQTTSELLAGDTTDHEEENEEQYLQENGVCRGDMRRGYIEESGGGEEGNREDEGEGEFNYQNTYGCSLSAQDILSFSLSSIYEERLDRCNPPTDR